ncbi:MAG TPA: hypothetical protein VGS07_22020 [Thermoanaerobaculia bacterium]|nr:hypothetical protein [Thermoanaerobaculia bacterium]
MAKRLGFWKALQKLGEPHSRFKNVFAVSVIALSLSVAATYVSGEAIGLKFLRGFAQVVIGISASVAAAAMIEIFSGIRILWQKYDRRRQFQKLFNIPDEESHKEESAKVAIVLARFSTGGGLLDTPNESYATSSQPVKRMREVNDQVFALADVKAASDLMLIFSKLGLPLPVLEPDEKIVEQLHGNSLSYGTYIAIGLQSNALTMAINGSQPDLFRISDAHSESPKLQIAERDPGKPLPLEQWSESYDSDRKTYDHVLIARTRLSKDKTLFILGGLEAKGTESVGDFIKVHWEDELTTWCDLITKLGVLGNCFAAVVRFKDSSFKRIGVVVPDRAI